MLNNAQKYNDTRTGEKYNESTNNAASSSLLECCSNLLFGQESSYRMSYNYTQIDPGWGPRVVQNVHNLDSVYMHSEIYTVLYFKTHYLHACMWISLDFFILGGKKLCPHRRHGYPMLALLFTKKNAKKKKSAMRPRNLSSEVSLVFAVIRSRLIRFPVRKPLS